MHDWPRLFTFASRRLDAPFALASLVGRTGASYRPPGARLLIAADGRYAGSISGGCLEDEIATEAGRVLASGVPVLRSIDTRPHFGCPGRLELLIERLPAGWMAEVGARLGRRTRFGIRTHYAIGNGSTPTATAAPGMAGVAPTGSRVVEALGSGGGEALRTGEICPAPSKSGVFFEEVTPQPRLVVVSGTPDADPVLQFAEVLGWEAHRIWPVGDAVRTGPVPEGVVCAALHLAERFPPDERTAVLIMTHHLARDLQYLRAVVPAGYSFIGLLGSRRRRETLLAALGEDGLLDDDTVAERLHAPVGLDLGADDPASIALSIVAEIQASWEGRAGGRLRDRPGAIHAGRIHA